jgi:hypothetical protein
MEVLRIAEAMRRGALLKPQHLGPGLADPGETRSCAMLAAIEGAGYGKIPPHPGMWVTDGRGPGHPAGPGTVVYETPEPWRILLSLPVRCPVGGCSWLDIARPHRSAHLIEAITHLNDHHRWSREAIADWIEPIENAYHAGRQSRVETAAKAIERMWRDEGVRDQALWDELRALENGQLNPVESRAVRSLQAELSRSSEEVVEETVSQV